MKKMKEIDVFTFQFPTTEGIRTWVIENSQPSLCFLDHFLTEGDVWIVLQTKEEFTPYGKDFSYNIHVWVGASSVPADEVIAARRAASMDLLLRRRASLHCERQGRECALFASYFGYNLQYKPGKYNDIYYAKNYAPGNQLYLLRSCNQIIRSKQVECCISSLNKHDPLMLVTDEVVYLLPRGWSYNRLLSVTDRVQFGEGILRRSNDGRVIRTVLLGRPPRSQTEFHCLHFTFFSYAEVEDWDKFYELLGWTDRDSFPPLPDGDPPEIASPAPTMLYEIRRNRKERVYYYAIRQPLRRHHLKSQSLYILTNDIDDVYLWIGKKNQDRNKAKLYGLAKIKEYIARKNLPSWSHMAIIPEGTEPLQFKEQFQNWIMD